VNLEPCSHFGKTPPCADLIIEKGIPKVVICNLDSNPLVSGKGVEKLKAAGIKVESGILEEEGRALNKRFFTFMEKKRPFILLKWAQTQDGFIARENFDSKWISNPLSRKLVHKWRTEESGVLVGYQTALSDDPLLNARDWIGDDPIRIVVDPDLQLPKSHHLFNQTQVTLCYNLKMDKTDEYVQFINISRENWVEEISKDLFKRKVLSVMIEGGFKTLKAFIGKGFWDEARIFTSETLFEKGIPAPVLNGRLSESVNINGDTLEVIQNDSPKGFFNIEN
jgi:diaminohydroxyphosphoribosylaminopyrimidine deaminase / 5-amino-6-(5-phosphoribosylamino)uracil reductase